VLALNQHVAEKHPHTLRSDSHHRRALLKPGGIGEGKEASWGQQRNYTPVIRQEGAENRKNLQKQEADLQDQPLDSPKPLPTYTTRRVSFAKVGRQYETY